MLPFKKLIGAGRISDEDVYMGCEVEDGKVDSLLLSEPAGVWKGGSQFMSWTRLEALLAIEEGSSADEIIVQSLLGVRVAEVRWLITWALLLVAWAIMLWLMRLSMTEIITIILEVKMMYLVIVEREMYLGKGGFIRKEIGRQQRS